MSKSARNRARSQKNALTETSPPWGTIAFFTVIALLVAVAIGWAGWQAFKPAEAISGLVEKDGLKQNHVQTSVKYDTVPPMGGDHDPTWQNCEGRVYDSPLRNENAVHSLEHGAVWFTYKPGLAADQIGKLKGKVEGTDYTLMSPVPDQSSPIVLTAWGKQVKVDKADDKRVDAFLKAYLKGPQTPEPGAACGGGKTTP